MKKLLSFLGALSLIGTSASSVVACGGTKTSQGDNDDTYDRNAGIAKLKEIASNVLNNYLKDHRAELTQSLDSDNENNFFNQSVFEKLVNENKNNENNGTFNIELKSNSDEQKNFESDLRKIFDNDYFRSEIQKEVSGQNLDVLINKLGGDSVFKSIDFIGINSNQYQLSTVSNSEKTIAYQFGFKCVINLNYIDENGNKALLQTDDSILIFSLIDNEVVSDFLDWSSDVLPAELFNFRDNETDNFGADSALHIKQDDFTNLENKEDIFVNFSQNINDYVTNTLGKSLNYSLSKILQKPEDYGGKDYNFSLTGSVNKDAVLEINKAAYSKNYQFGFDADYLSTEVVGREGDSYDLDSYTANQEVYSAVLSDPEYLLDESKDFKQPSENGEDVFKKASEEYVALNKNSKSISGDYKPFDTSVFGEAFNTFGKKFTMAGGNESTQVSNKNSLTDDEQKETYAFGTTGFQNVPVTIDGFSGHFYINFNVPWTFTFTGIERVQTYAIFFETLARLRKGFNLHFFEDIKDIDDNATSAKAFLTLKSRSENSLADGGYDIFGQLTQNNSSDLETASLIYGWDNVFTSTSAGPENITHTNFKPYFEANKSSWGLDSLEDLVFRRTNGYDLTPGSDIKVRMVNNKVIAVKTAFDYQKEYGGVVLSIIDNLGRVGLNFSTIAEEHVPLTIYRQDGKITEVADPFEYINSYLLADDSLLIS